MRWLRPFLAILGVLLAAYLVVALFVDPPPVPSHPFFERTRTLAIAHQGGRGLWPENTSFAFERAVAMGVDVLEMDLHETSDGHLVVMHDDAVDRTTDGSGLLGEMTLEEILELDAGYDFEDAEGRHPYRGRGLRVPVLGEVLASFPGVRLNLEMKRFSDGAARELCRLLRAHGRTEESLVASFGHEPMRAFRGACPEVATSATLREGLLLYYLNRVHLGGLYRSPAVAFEFPEYFGDIHVIQPPFLDLARSINVRVQVWTVNEIDDMRRLLELGVDGIVTDYPDRLLRLLGRID